MKGVIATTWPQSPSRMTVIGGPNLDTPMLQDGQGLDPEAGMDRESHGARRGGQRHGPRPPAADHKESGTFQRQ